MGDAATVNARKAKVLRAIVSHYVRSGEPVGSKTIVERFRLGVSPATVRNEMGALEESGYIYQPHTSAGRVPTDRGYRYFVDAWARDVKLPAGDAQKIRRFFGEPRWELEQGLRETAALLSSLTDHAAVVFAPALEKSVVLKIELVRLSQGRAMILLVTDSGRVENHVVLVPEEWSDETLEEAGRVLERIVGGHPLDEAAGAIRGAVDRLPEGFREPLHAVAQALDDELSTHEAERVFLEGTSNIVDEEKFADLETVRQVVGALEHRRLVLEVLADALSTEAVSVRIGSENAVEEMQFCSIITSPYGAGGETIGSLGIVGPTRMDYRRTIAAVHEVASALGRMLSELGI